MANPNEMFPDFPFVTNDGILRIEARLIGEAPCDTWGSWRGGLLSSSDPDQNGFFQDYGYFECRIKLPQGPGTWPAFWLNSWSGAEIDILEHYGRAPEVYHTVLFNWDFDWHLSPDEQHHVGEATDDYRSTLTEEYHTYGALVSPEKMVFYLDREPVWELPTPPYFQHVDYYVLVNLVLGSGWSTCETPNPSYMYVDYVKVWNLPDGYKKAPVVSMTGPANSTMYAEGDDVVVTAEASDEDGIIAKVEFYSNNKKVGEATSEPFTFTIEDVQSGSYKVFAIAIDADGISSISGTVSFAVNGTLPEPWENQDVGEVGVASTADEIRGNFSIKGSGADIWNEADAFHFMHQNFTGDGQIFAKVRSLANTNDWAKTGVMFRETLDAGSKHALMAVTTVNGTAFQRRPTTDGTSLHTGGSAVAAPYWVKLVRNGNVFTGYESEDGEVWVLVGEETIEMQDEVCVGIAVTSHNDGELCQTIINDLSVSSDISDVAENPTVLPLQFTLLLAYPNPFNPGTTISYELPRAAHVVIDIYNILGHRIARLKDEHVQAGHHSIVWNAENDMG